MRHLNITWRQEAGASLIEAQKAAGHANLAMTWKYTVIDTARERQHVQAILDRINPVGGVQ